MWSEPEKVKKVAKHACNDKGQLFYLCSFSGTAFQRQLYWVSQKELRVACLNLEANYWNSQMKKLSVPTRCIVPHFCSGEIANMWRRVATSSTSNMQERLRDEMQKLLNRNKKRKAKEFKARKVWIKTSVLDTKIFSFLVRQYVSQHSRPHMTASNFNGPAVQVLSTDVLCAVLNGLPCLKEVDQTRWPMVIASVKEDCDATKCGKPVEVLKTDTAQCDVSVSGDVHLVAAENLSVTPAQMSFDYVKGRVMLHFDQATVTNDSAASMAMVRMAEQPRTICSMLGKHFGGF